MMPVCNESEKVRNSFREQGQQNLINSERRRIELQSDLLTFQRDQRLSRAVRLQWQWQELSERERRAQQQNKQLLQEFERAQDTLRDMVARTAAMNTIRVEYEKYLDDNYPRWQQELKEKTLSAQRKRMEQHLKESIRRMEEKTGTASPISAQASLSQAQVPQTQNGQPDCSSHSFQSSWMTHARYHLASPHTMLSFNPKRTQVSHHTTESLPPPPHFHPFHLPHPQPFQYPHPSSIPIQPQTLTQQSSTMWAPQREYPLDWAGRVAVFPSRTQFGYQSSMADPSISDPQGWAVVEGIGVEEEVKEGSPVARIEGESSDGHRPRGNEQSHELDIKPVRLSSGHGESSECSRASGRASGESDSRTKRKKKEQKEGRVKPSSVDREETGLSSGRSVGPDVEASASRESGAHSSEGDDATSGGGSTRSRQSAGLSVKQSKKRREKAKSKGEETGSPVEDPGSQIKESPSPVQESERHREESESLGGESGSVSVKLKGCEEEVEETEGEQESLGVEGGTTGEEEVMEEQNGDDEENSERVKEEGEEGEMDEESPRDEEEEEEGRAEEEGREELDEEGQEGEEEVEDLHGETTDEREDLSDGEKEEEAGEGAEDEEASAVEEPVEEEEESVEEEEQSSQQAEELSKEVDHEEERESDDSIILPKEHRPAENRPILAEEEEAMIGDDHQGDDDHGEDARLEKGYSWSGDPTHAFQDEHDDIESLLAPQVETQKKLENEQIAPDSKSKAIAGDLNSSSEEEDLKKKTAPSPVARNTDSDDEFDDFYD